jgi:hypothetical protein
MRYIFIIIFSLLISSAFSQNNFRLEALLHKTFPEKSDIDGRWVYIKEEAKIERIDNTQMNSILGSYDIYKLTLINYLGYHVNQGICTILVDSSLSKLILVEPIWYSGLSESLIKIIVKSRFENKNKLMAALNELHLLQVISSNNKFIKTKETNDVIYFDLAYFREDSLITESEFAQSTVINHKGDIYRQVEVRFKKGKIKDYTIYNPGLKDEKLYKDSYKQIIK